MSATLEKRSTRFAARAMPTMLMAASVLLPTRDAHADSGRLNLHLDVGIGGVLAGDASRRNPMANDPAVGGMGIILLDWQLRAPFAIEGMVGGGGFANGFPGTG